MEEKSNGTIQVTRISQWANAQRSINLFIDGDKVGSIRDGESIPFKVSKGKHTLQAKLDWSHSNLLNINLKPNEAISFEVGCHLKGWKVHLALFYLFIPHKYIYLKPVTL